jgi:ribosomal protein S7
MRRNRSTPRPVAADSRFRSRLVQQIINKVMLDGKKSGAESIVYDALALVGERSGRSRRAGDETASIHFSSSAAMVIPSADERNTGLSGARSKSAAAKAFAAEGMR